MKEKVLSILPFVTLAIITIALAIFTIVGQVGDTSLYSNPMMIAGWCIVALSASFLIFRKRKTMGLPTIMVHASFILILLGAFVSHFSEMGMIHLREDEPQSYALTEDYKPMKLPFSITLQKFEIEYYHASDAPKDFISHVAIETRGDDAVETHGRASNNGIHRISMNKVLDIDGYRLFQSSYDEDLKGSVIIVAHDPVGTTITYVGYLMLAISMLLFLFGKRNYFHQILRNPLWKSFAVVAMVMMPRLAGSTEYYSVAQNNSVAQDTKDFSRIPIIYNGRIAPMETYALDFTRKLTGKDSYGEYDATQVLAGWILAPEDWRHEKMIKSEYGMIDFDSAIDSLNKRLRAKLMTREFDALDEKIGLILDLQSGDAIKYAPSDVDYPEWKFEVEHIYNRYCKTAPLAYASLLLGLLSFVSMLRRKMIEFKWLFVAASAIIFICISAIMAMRGVISGRLPMSNGYETMLFISWIAYASTIIAGYKISLVFPAGFFVGGFALLVSKLGMMNPEITPLMPVLASPWMSIHVTLMMLSYTAYAIMAFNSVGYLVLQTKDLDDGVVEHETSVVENRTEHGTRLALLNRFLLYPATFMLAIGMFIGAVWANESWGSYWSWDPKETWALITMIIYAMAFHRESISWMKNDKAFQIYILVSFASIIMTYFGVNYLLGGMHSYAG
ncbi:MAG: cytochrome c biogenesis protein CcsA [Paludibacteraceae bacterium]|nr:cytochrome c biogenesis protein CcsA [Paludibacteraceae bacterium]